MRGTLLFVHGTGVRDVRTSLGLIRKGVQEHVGLDPAQVQAVEWGRAVGPQDLDITSVLPPAPVTRALGGPEPSEADIEAATWELLTADPFLELRVLAEVEHAADGGGTGSFFGDVPDVEARRRLLHLGVDGEVLTAAGVTDADVAAAAARTADSAELAAAASRAGAWNAPELVAAVSRGVVAAVIADALDADDPGAELPSLVFDAAARGRLVVAVAHAYAPDGTRGIVGDAVRKVVTPLAQRMATRAAVKRRAQFMDPLSDFIRDVAWYVARGQLVRDFIADAVLQHRDKGPVVLLAHSLGGIAAVDLMSAPQASRPDVALLVTVGSQAPLMYLLDALATLRPGGGGSPFVPWVNVYDRQDLLSFYAGGAFVNSSAGNGAAGIVDVAVDSAVPFPQSHSAYWNVPALYETLAKHWPEP